MPQEANHAGVVADWLEKNSQNATSESLGDLFCLAFNTIWQRALRTIGVITLTAIGDRALRFTTDRYPLLEFITLEQDGIRCDDFRAKTAGLAPEELTAAIGYALTQFLAILGGMTSEILSPALHAELLAIGVPDAASAKPIKPHGKSGEVGEKIMPSNHEIARLRSGIPNFDVLLSGGLPTGSVIGVVGPPGSGKSILTQQICFRNAAPERAVLYFNTLSEPTAKTLTHLSQFDFFDSSKLDNKQFHFIDIGGVLRDKGLETASKQIMDFIREIRPAIVVIDSFKAFDDWARSGAEKRKFGYELAANLMAWQATAFLLGEYAQEDIASNPLFSIIDGLMFMTQREESGEHQRFLQIVKMRGTPHSRSAYSFEISQRGIDVFASGLTIGREPAAEAAAEAAPPPRRMKTGISKLDELLGEGIPLGSSLLVGGVAGTGKTVLLLEFLYRGALAGEKGILFSFEETEERLRAAAAGLGWDFNREIERGMIELVFIPQPEIFVEKHLFMVQRKIEAMGARRVAMDSVSVFLHNLLDEPELSREKVYQIASLVQNAQAVGLLATDIPYGSHQISRFGVEETVVDGVILLSATEEGFERQRYIEVYKLRNTAHLKGRHNMLIGRGGIQIYPRYFASDLLNMPPPPLNPSKRLSTGVPSLDQLIGGGVYEKSVTLISGSAGIGKSTLGMHFAIEGARQNERSLLVTLEEGPEQIIRAAEMLGLPMNQGINDGLIEVMYLSRQSVRANQFLSVLTDRITSQGVRRLVLDGVGHIVTGDIHPEDLRQMLFALATRFKTLGVTSLFTLESKSLHSSDNATEEGFSPIADNLFVMRYERTPHAFHPFITVIKTRESTHDTGAYPFSIGQGGVKISAVPLGAAATPAEHHPGDAARETPIHEHNPPP